MPICDDLTGLACAVAGLGALLYVTYRVWQSLARAEPIDVFPLLRPFAIGICILFFQPLVLGTLNGVLSPIVTGTHEIMANQTLDMNKLQQDKDRLEGEMMLRNPQTAYLVSDEEMDKQLDALGWSPQDLQTMEVMYEKQAGFWVQNLLVECVRWLLELIFKAAALVVDTVRTFYLIVLSILGPIAFAISVYDGFQSTLIGWMGRYIGVYLWLPVADLFSAMLARIQVLSLQKDIALMESDPLYMFDSNNLVYLIFLLIGIFGYFTVPTVSSWIIQAGGFGGAYNRKLNAQGGKAVNMTSAMAGAATGNAWGAIKGALIPKK